MAKVTIQNGQFQDAAGTLQAGSLVLQLSQDAVVSGTGQVAPKAISIAVVAGQATATPVWGNDNLTPSGTTYTARLFDTSGALVWGPENWSIVGVGPIEINTLVPASSSISYPSAVDLTSTQTITGNKTFSGQNVLGNVNTFNNILYVGGGITSWSGADIGAQINSAYAALPATGGTIVILPKTGGGSYLFSTPITFTTAHKPVLLMGTGIAGTSGNNNAGVILEYTPTTATAAITLDYTDSAGSNIMAHGIRDLSIWNNHTFSPGGTGSSATGIAVGPTNGGAGQAEFSNLNIEGFGKGFDGSGGNSVGWGMVWRNCRFVYNTTGLIPVNGENQSVYGGQFVSNGTGVQSGTAEMYFFSVSFDSNTVVGANWTGAASVTTVGFVGCHFENLGGTTANYVQGTANFQFFGGVMENDSTTSNVNWYVSASGFALYVSGLEIHSSGQTATQVFLLNSPVRAYLAPINFSPTTLTTLVGGANAANATIRQTYANSANTNPLITEESQFKAPLGVGDATFTPSTAAGLHIRVNAASKNPLRLEDTNTPRVIDQGPAVTGAARMSWYDATGSKELLGAAWGTDRKLVMSRLAPNLGTAYSGADAAIVLSAGWGTTRTVSAAAGYDQAFSFVVNATGTGQAASPTITITFKDGTWTTVPQFHVMRNDNIAPTGTVLTWTATATTLTITFNGTPTAANSYTFVCIGMGN